MIDPVEHDLNCHLVKEEEKIRQQEQAETAAEARIKYVDADEIGEAMKTMGGQEVRISFLIATGADNADLGRLVREIVFNYLIEDELSGFENGR